AVNERGDDSAADGEPQKSFDPAKHEQSQISNLKFQIPNLKFQISNSKSQIPNLKSLTRAS
ncbi:MAG TPA: hypothetical protein VK137_07775, partial [Planctomycetaceae bacterium]|nr:hypothetical protein [Planctomycetaceae bacterium]